MYLVYLQGDPLTLLQNYNGFQPRTTSRQTFSKAHIQYTVQQIREWIAIVHLIDITQHTNAEPASSHLISYNHVCHRPYGIGFRAHIICIYCNIADFSFFADSRCLIFIVLANQYKNVWFQHFFSKTFMLQKEQTQMKAVPLCFIVLLSQDFMELHIQFFLCCCIMLMIY